MSNKLIEIKKNEQFGGKEITITTNQNNDENKNVNVFVKLITGALIGFVNGFWGGGGGMICVPILMQIIKLPEKKSHATTLLIMLPLSVSSLVVYFLGGSLQIMEALKIGLGFVLGGVIGAIILKFINNVWLGIIFSVIIIAGGVKLLIWKIGFIWC